MNMNYWNHVETIAVVDGIQWIFPKNILSLFDFLNLWPDLEVILSGSFWHVLWRSFWHSIWHLFCHAFWRIFWHAFWHIFWHSLNHRYIFGGSLWSRSGGNTFILSLLFVSGGERCDLALAVEVRRGTLWSWACCSGPAGAHCHLALAIEVQRGTLWSWACCLSPAGNTAIYTVALAVEVWRGTLWSWACCLGPAGNTAILSS